jgi:Na+-transporting methylmalonyl-CoA/oxaloacetate decarboxylase gamma subunit
MILGMILGFAAVFFIAAACYAVGLLAIRMTVKRPARIESRSPAASS